MFLGRDAGREGMKGEFEEVWKRIRALEGEAFETKTGLPFTYKIDGEGLLPSRTKYRLSRKDIQTAYEQFPLDGPAPLNAIVRGPTYIWAILHDKRIIKA